MDDARTIAWPSPTPLEAPLGGGVPKMPDAAEGVTEARKRAAEAEDYARLRLDSLFAEARAICAVVGLVPLSKLDGIADAAPAPRAKVRRRAKSATAPRGGLHRGLPKEPPASPEPGSESRP